MGKKWVKRTTFTIYHGNKTVVWAAVIASLLRLLIPSHCEHPKSLSE